MRETSRTQTAAIIANKELSIMRWKWFAWDPSNVKNTAAAIDKDSLVILSVDNKISVAITKRRMRETIKLTRMLLVSRGGGKVHHNMPLPYDTKLFDGRLIIFVPQNSAEHNINKQIKLHKKIEFWIWNEHHHIIIER